MPQILALGARRGLGTGTEGMPLALRWKWAVQWFPAWNNGQCWRLLGGEGTVSSMFTSSCVRMTCLTVQVMVDGFLDQLE